MNPKIVKLDIPKHLRELLFSKPHGIAYKEILQNYNIEIIVPTNPRLPISFKGFYPDIQYGPRKLEKYVEEVREMELRVEVIVTKQFARELKNNLRRALEVIERETMSMIEVFDCFLVIYNLEQDNVEKANVKLKDLFTKFMRIRREKHTRSKEPISEEHLFVEEVWFAKDIRRPSQNVI